MNSIFSKKVASTVFAHKRLVLAGVFLFFVGIFGLFSFSRTNEAHAFACTAVAGTVNWNNPASWTGCNSSYPGSPGNGNADTVTIPDTAVVMTANTSVTVASITFTGGTSASSISVSGGIVLTVTGSVTINAPTASVVKQLSVGTGTLNSNGITISGGSSAGRNAIVSVTTGTITTTSGITFSGTAAQAQFTTTGAATVNLTGTISSGGTATIDSTTTLVSTGTSVINLASTWGSLSVNSGTLTLGGVNITFSGAVSISGTLTTSSATGTVTFSSTVVVNSGGTLSFSSYGKVTNWNGAITMNGTTFNTGSTSSTANLTNTFAISGSSDMTFGGTTTVTGSITNNNSGVVIMNWFNGAGGWTQGTGSTLRFVQNSGSGTNTVTTFDASTNNNTVDYNTGNQTVRAVSYHHLSFSGSGSKTVTGVTTILGNFSASGSISTGSAVEFTTIGGSMSIAGTASITLGAAVTVASLSISGGSLTTQSYAFTVSGTTTLSGGTLGVYSAGAKTFNGLITMNGGTFNGSSTAVEFNTGVTNNSGSFAFTGTVTIDTPGVTFSGANTTSIGTITVTSPGTIINNGTVTSTTLINGTGSWTQGLNSVLNVNGNYAAITITTLDASTNANTVSYGSNAGSTCKEVQYHNLILAGSGSKTCLIAETVLGNLTFSGGTIWSNASNAVEVNGNFTATSCSQCFTQQAFTVHGTSQINIDFSVHSGGVQTYDGDVTFTGGGLRSSYSNSTVTFGGNVINNGAVNLGLSLPGTTNFTSSTGTISGTGPSTLSNVQINGSASLTNNTTITINSTPGISGTGTFIMGTNSVLNISGATAPTITTFDASTNVNTVNYSGSTQTARVLTYHHLTLSGSSTKTLTGITTLNGNLSTSGTASVTITSNMVVGGSVDVGVNSTLVAHTGTLTIGNDFNRIGTFTHNNGTVVFNDNSQITVISGQPVFNNFSVTTAGKTIQVTSGDTLTILGALTITGSNGNNVILTSTTGSSSFNMTFQNASNSVTYLSVSWSACVSSYDINVYDGTSTNLGNNGACWLFSAPGTINISGTANGNNSATVRVVVNGSLSGVTTTISGGAWTLAGVTVPNGGTVLVWVDNVSEANEATGIAKYDGEGNITGMALTTNSVTIGSADTSSFTGPDFNIYDSDNDEDILFNATTNSLTTYTGENQNITFNILSGATYTVSSGEILSVNSINISGDLVGSSTGLISIRGSWTNSGDYTANNGSVTFASLGTDNTISGTLSGASGRFYNIMFEGNAATWTVNNSMEVSNNLNIASGELIAPSNLTITGNFYNYGDFTSGSGEVIFNATTTGKVLAGNFAGSNRFNDLTFHGTGGVWTSHADIEVNDDLSLNEGTFNSNTNLIVNGGTVTGNGILQFNSSTNATGFTFIGAGPSHTCAIDIKTYVYCWGGNYAGVLGINDPVNTSRYTPVRVLAGAATASDTDGTYLKNIKEITGEFSHTCAVSYAGNVYCWGESDWGALGINSTTPDRLVPARVVKGTATGSDTDGTYLVNAKTITGSDNNSCVATNSGNVYCWGYAGNNGDGNTGQRNSPVQVLKGAATGDDTDGTYLTNVRQISGGSSHHCAVTFQNFLYCWGSNHYGQGGVNSTSQNYIPARVLKGVASGEDADSTYLINVASVGAGQNATCAVMVSGNFYCWGNAGSNYLGDGQSSVNRLTPVRVLKGTATGADTDGTNLINIVESSPTYSHNCARAASGAVYCWGSGGSGQLGDNGSTTRATPVRVLKGDAKGADTDGTNLINIRKLAGGNGYTCAVSNSGSPYCWGNRGYAGDNQVSADRAVPVDVQSYTTQFTNVSMGGTFTCGVHMRTTVYCWGHSFFGSLGDGTDTIRRFPAQVVKGDAVGADSDGTYLTNIRQVITASINSCALSHSGAVYCWGYGASGQNGDGQTVTNRLAPVRVLKGAATGGDSDGTYLTNIRLISSSGSTTCAVSYNDKAYCWGSEGGAGALGDNTQSATRSSPVQVLKGAAVAADHDGTYLTNVDHISAGGVHVCAVTNSGNAYCWGESTEGRIGDGQTGTDRYTPVRVVKGAATGADTDGTYLVNIRQIFANQVNTCALSFSGYTYCWGDTNQGGQVGDNQAGTDRSSPVKVVKGNALSTDSDGTYLTNVRKITIGYGSVCSISYSGNTYCWGLDRYNGINDTSYHPYPMRMLKGSAFSANTDGTYMLNLQDISSAGNGGTDGGTVMISQDGVIYCTMWTLQSISVCGNNSSGTSYVPILPGYALTPSKDVPTTTFNGTGSLGGTTDWNLVNASFGTNSAGSSTLTGSGAINIYGDLNVASSHTVNAGSKIITIRDDFANAGTYEGDTGTLVFDNSGEVTTVLGSGVTNFNNLTITAAGKTVQFEAGEMFTINGALAITGTAKENIIITSTADDEQWLVNHQGTESVTYATISWSGCSSSPESDYIDVSDGTSTDGGNNDTCWAFVPIIELIFGPGSGPTGGGPGSIFNSGQTSNNQDGGSGPTNDTGEGEPGAGGSSGGSQGSGGGGGASP